MRVDADWVEVLQVKPKEMGVIASMSRAPAVDGWFVRVNRLGFADRRARGVRAYRPWLKWSGML